MALTASKMMELGFTAPNFILFDVVTEKKLSLIEISKNKTATVVAFLCNHCPYVKHILQAWVECAHQYQSQNIAFVAINSNDVEKYPDDSPEKMKALSEKLSFSFPYLCDADQNVAQSYMAACTPDLYVFDKNLGCVYRGQFDDSRPGNNAPVDGHSLKEALDCVVKGITPSSIQKPSMGCNIKLK
jgi:peroxiredoxin